MPGSLGSGNSMAGLLKAEAVRVAGIYQDRHAVDSCGVSTYKASSRTISINSSFEITLS